MCICICTYIYEESKICNIYIYIYKLTGLMVKMETVREWVSGVGCRGAGVGGEGWVKVVVGGGVGWFFFLEGFILKIKRKKK